jgi:hypothetical protein
MLNKTSLYCFLLYRECCRLLAWRMGSVACRLHRHYHVDKRGSHIMTDLRLWSFFTSLRVTVFTKLVTSHERY